MTPAELLALLRAHPDAAHVAVRLHRVVRPWRRRADAWRARVEGWGAVDDWWVVPAPEGRWCIEGEPTTYATAEEAMAVADAYFRSEGWAPAGRA